VYHLIVSKFFVSVFGGSIQNTDILIFCFQTHSFDVSDVMIIIIRAEYSTECFFHLQISTWEKQCRLMQSHARARNQKQTRMSSVRQVRPLRGCQCS
jgi:hypothetical protein